MRTTGAVAPGPVRRPDDPPGTIGATIFGCAGPQLSPAEAAFFRDAAPWGFILFARNIETPDQVRRLVGDLRAAVGRAAPVLIDQEGGRVQRLRPPSWRDWPAPLAAARAAGRGAERAIWLRYRLIAAELSALGIDANCAPCTDLAHRGTHPFLRDRCLGTTPAAVAVRARAAVAAHLAGGVLPVIKHLPGHGRARADSHRALPVVTTPLHRLEATDFAALRPLADAPLAMTAHVVFSALDPDHPATLSRIVIDYLRDRLGVTGAIMTDDLVMSALSGGAGARAEAARSAGCDLVLHCSGDPVEMAAVAGAAGRLADAGAGRAAAALAARRAAEPVDTAALEAELSALTGAPARARTASRSEDR